MKNYEKEIGSLLSLLTLEEKIGMIHGAGLFCTEGVPRLGIPALHMSDGPMGVRAEFANDEWRNVGTTDDFVTYLPCNSAVASTWNRTLAEKMGSVLGEEARGRGKDVILAPGINIKRSPLCGRNFEYMSEDPELVEELVVPMIQGIQKHDVAACVKHFAANSQETGRLSVNTIVDERTLREIYFPGFLAAIKKAGAYTLMGAYNRLNGEHCCMSKSLLNDVLRGEWGYDGTVISDWGGVHDTRLAAESALDIEMDVTSRFSEHYMADALLEKVRAGEISESLVDEKVRNILRLMFRLHMIGEERSSRKSGTYNTPQHREAALAIAQESVILLKNEKLLPLRAEKVKKLAVIGQNAALTHANGGGSAEIKALYEITPLLGIKMLLGGNVDVRYAPGYYIPEKEKASDMNWQATSTMNNRKENQETEAHADDKKMQRRYQQEAVAIAKECDEVIFIGGLTHEYDTEGRDRESMKLPYGQDELIEELLSIKPNTVVVMVAGSPVEMDWEEKCKALVWSYYAGTEGGTALAGVLFGKINPSGKLAETFPRNAMQCPAHVAGEFGNADAVEYKEGVMVGYRYYDSEGTDIRYCFGHGLSYSCFSYSNLRAVWDKVQKRCEIALTVKNDSGVDGKETVQIYVAPQTASVERPSHELRAFEKVDLKAGEQKELRFTLELLDFSYYRMESEAFAAEPGRYRIEAAASSRDIRLVQEIEL